MQRSTPASGVYEYTVVLEPTDPEGYSVHVPALPGVVTSGDTIEEALAMAREAIALHVRGLIEDGEAVPIETPPRRRTQRVRLPVRVAARRRVVRSDAWVPGERLRTLKRPAPSPRPPHRPDPIP
jgi:predicted RNase H-like HicB family nuclease